MKLQYWIHQLLIKSFKMKNVKIDPKMCLMSKPDFFQENNMYVIIYFSASEDCNRLDKF